MGSHPIQFLTQLPIPISHNAIQFLTQLPISRPRRFAYDNYTNSRARRHRRFSGGRSGGSRWDWDPNRRSRFKDAYATDDYDEEEDEYGSAKRRMWWSDEFDDEEEDEGFGILEASIGFSWVLKVFRAFGWMIPAVIISFLLGTGPNTIMMAIALPLAQSALSLAAETLWGTSYENPKSKSKRKKKRRFTSTPNRRRVEKEDEIRFQARKEAGNYKSWVDANNFLNKNGKRSEQDFGGWDELDKEPRVTPIKGVDEKSAHERLKISRRTKGDTPLLMRLLIAMFPYLGFWTKFF